MAKGSSKPASRSSSKVTSKPKAPAQRRPMIQRRGIGNGRPPALDPLHMALLAHILKGGGGPPGGMPDGGGMMPPGGGMQGQ